MRLINKIAMGIIAAAYLGFLGYALHRAKEDQVYERDSKIIAGVKSYDVNEDGLADVIIKYKNEQSKIYINQGDSQCKILDDVVQDEVDEIYQKIENNGDEK